VANIRKVRELARSGHTDQALALTAEVLRSSGDCPYLLVLRAQLIQVSDADPSVCLRDAEACLLAALDIDADYAPALEELAHYYAVGRSQSRLGKFRACAEDGRHSPCGDADNT
jgi:hypothetical protein